MRAEDWAKATEEDKEIIRSNKRAWYAKSRAERTEEEIAADRRYERIRVARWRNALPEDKKNELTKKSSSWRAANPERQKKSWKSWWLKTNYGITIEDYDEMVEAQEGRCLICIEPTDKLVVDHDHETGKVRGLLCSACNTGIGHLKDSTERLFSAIDYLTKSRQSDNSEVPQHD